jgi:hypothetical protein
MPGKDHYIEISVSSTGTINYDFPKCHARREDSITWTCKQGPFAIQFLGVSPVETADARSQGRNPVSRKVRTNVDGGTYPYGCAVCVDDQVYLDASCPVIIIDYP